MTGTACRGPQSALDPAGRDAEGLLDLFVLMSVAAAVVWVAVVGLTLYATHLRPGTKHPRPARGLIIGGGAIAPVIGLGALLVRGLAPLPGGLPGITLGFFSAASLAVVIPTGVQIFCFIATLLGGVVVRSVPLLYVFGGFATFVLGGLTGVMVAVAPFDFQAHDTYFVVAHLHSVLIGGAVFPLVAGLYYFYPMVTGRMLSARLGRLAFWPVFAGFNLTFVPMYVTGLRGLPRRVYTYEAGLGFDTLNLVSTIGFVGATTDLPQYTERGGMLYVFTLP